jgi:hypothetical protein
VQGIKQRHQTCGRPLASKASSDDTSYRMPLKEVLRKELGTNPKAYIQETVERVEKIIEALDSEELTGSEKSSVQQYKERLRAHTRRALYELIAIL